MNWPLQGLVVVERGMERQGVGKWQGGSCLDAIVLLHAAILVAGCTDKQLAQDVQMGILSGGCTTMQLWIIF